ncbi:MAG: septum formation inhibitor Maf [Gammaproteobacteria bacterium]|nr:septum formation inhibitor Maf [Gammaproteobacteria bacterium]
MLSEKPKLILASQSPRRQSLLRQFDIPFEIIVADIDETPFRDEQPDQMTLRLAREKALAVFKKVGADYRVLGGDTTVTIKGTILGKPRNRQHAIEMLKRLSGNTHLVHSAVALVNQGICQTRLCSTAVTFFELTDNQITSYCNSQDPYDKAGAYGVQGHAGQFVKQLEGSYSGVMGLPLWETHQLLHQFQSNITEDLN